jgi:hypothetical protein
MKLLYLVFHSYHNIITMLFIGVTSNTLNRQLVYHTKTISRNIRMQGKIMSIVRHKSTTERNSSLGARLRFLVTRGWTFLVDMVISILHMPNARARASIVSSLRLVILLQILVDNASIIANAFLCETIASFL